jgi:hypothetical protein
MKLAEALEMEDEELNIRVATHMGWRRHQLKGEREKWVHRHDDASILHSQLPDYLNDLNVAALMENDLDKDYLVELYDYNLNRVSDGAYTWGLSARQKCQAYVLTMAGRS